MDALITIAVIAWVILTINRKAKQAAGQGQKTSPGPVRPSARMRDIRELSRRAPEAEAAKQAAAVAAAEVAPRAEPARPAYTPPRDQAPQDDFARLSSEAAFSYGMADYEFRQETRETGPSFYDERKDPVPVSLPGLNLRFNRSALVEGVVYSEILGSRSRGRSNRWNRYAR